MSLLFNRLQRLFDEGHARQALNLRDDAAHAPPRKPRAAAVLIAITEREEPGVLLIHRPEGMRTHPGQVAFPGGKIDPGEDAIRAALREADEELALSPKNIRIIGQSDPYCSITNFHVTPVLGVIPPDLPLTPNPDEVADWFEAPLRFVLDPANHHMKSSIFQGVERHYLECFWEGHRIWGVTAAILANLAQRISHDHI
jgi:8-oxo-dGTP pyrophosphatase MutT (NUDIX family)